MTSHEPAALSPSPLPHRTGKARLSLAHDLTLVQFLVLAAQLAIVLLLLQRFKIEENSGLLKLLPLIFAGFIVHVWLPLHWRLPFFLALSLAAIASLFGPKYGTCLVAVGLALVAICHLPIAFRARLALLVAAAAGLAAVRGGLILPSRTGVSGLLLPVLGSMFMFRLIIYLYDLRHEKKPATIWQRLSYFFLLPNVCFPLFPVVDFQAFRRTYYDTHSHAIYQKGVSWILRGVMHLLVYRLVYYHLMPAPSQIQGLAGVLQFMLANYLLYLRISGQFHLIVGILCLFGFNLPETHHLYFLATGFNDYWRRINIYWKDFMMKIFYYPAFMRLRRTGTTTALVASTALVFAATWLLHSYQWFWLRGTFPLHATDALFWGILGGLVVVNTLVEARRGRKRSLGPPELNIAGAIALSLRTVATFAFICILWSLWTSPSVAAWLSLLSAARHSGPAAFAWLLAALLLVVAAVAAAYYAMAGGRLAAALRHRPLAVAASTGPAAAPPLRLRPAALCVSSALLLLIAGLPQVKGSLPQGMSPWLASLEQSQLNQRDDELMDRGYYEGLLDADKYTSALWTAQLGQPADWKATSGSEVVRSTGDLLDYELIPSYEAPYKRAPFRTNRWGMRGDECPQAKPPGTCRIALLGASYEMGAGVENGQIYPAVLERRLNQRPPGAPFARYEVLNFAVGGYSVLQNVVLAEEKIFPFEPDVVLYALYTTEKRRLTMRLNRIVQDELPVPFGHVESILRRARVTPGMDRSEIQRRLDPYLDEVIESSMGQIAEACRRRNVTPVCVLLPTTAEDHQTAARAFASLAPLAQRAGFITLALPDAYGRHPQASIRLAPWDTHPNPLGHRLLGEALYELLRRNEPALGLGLAGATLLSDDVN